jgi:hypothetical protein
MKQKGWLLLILILMAGCGKGMEFFPDESKVNAFSIPSKTDVKLDSFVISDPVNITGNSLPANVSIENGEYSFVFSNISAGKQDTSFTSKNGSLAAGGGSLRVQHKSASTLGTNTTTTIKIGSRTATFTSTTIKVPIQTNITSASNNPTNITTTQIATDTSGSIKLLKLTTIENFRSASSVNFSTEYQFQNITTSRVNFNLTLNGYTASNVLVFTKPFNWALDGGKTQTNSVSYGDALTIAQYDSITKWVVSDFAKL